MTTIKVNTGVCLYCKQDGFVEIPENEYVKGVTAYNQGALIQDAFPNLTPDKCEQIISGTHPKCWGEMFGVVTW